MAQSSEQLNAAIIASVLHAADDQPVVVALGGGADSAVLLGATAEAQSERSDEQSLRAVFVRHGLPSGELLEKAAIDLTSELGIPLSVLDAPVDDGPDLESRAREARYSAIEADLASGEVAMTGHTADDQAETVLMRLARGSGSAGLSGIPSERGPWRRPLLGFSRATLRAAAQAQGLPFVDDPSNSDERFTRSRVRHDVMPNLERELPGSVRDGLARSARLLRNDDGYLADIARAIPIHRLPGCVRIAAAPLATTGPVIATRAVREGLRHLLGGYPGEETDVDAVMAVAADGAPRTVSGGFVVTNEGPWVRIGSVPSPAGPVSVGAGGRFEWEGATYRIFESALGPPPLLPGGRFTMMAASALSLPLEFRGVRAGDVVDTGEGSTPVVEVLRSHGVHADLRPVSLLAVDGGSIAAVVGVRTAAWAAPRTGEAVVIVERE